MSALAAVVIVLVGGVLLLELAEHVLLPLLALRGGRGRRSVTGAEGMVGKVVEVKRWRGGEGQVMADGELWTAVCVHELEPGDRAVVRQVRGLRLEVAKVAAGADALQ